MEGWEGNLGSEVNRAELVAPGTGRRQKTSRWIIQGSNAGEGSHLKVIQGHAEHHAQGEVPGRSLR